MEVFERKSQYERFNSRFQGIARSKEYNDKFCLLRILPRDFGAHLIKKRVAMHITTGSIVYLSTVLIYLSAN